MNHEKTYVLLETASNNESHKLSFLFKSTEDATKFMKVFSDNWCTLNFDMRSIPQDSKYITKYQLEQIERDPEGRANENLFYGFAFLKETGDLNNNQKRYVENYLNNNSPLKLSTETIYVLKHLKANLFNKKSWETSADICKGIKACEEEIDYILDNDEKTKQHMQW